MDVKQRRSMMVVKPNELAQKGRSLLSGKQIEIVEYLLSCVRPQDEPEYVYIFDIQEFCELFGLFGRSGTHYDTLKRELKNIADVSCWIVEGKSRRLFRWLNEVVIDEGSGQIAVSFHKTVRDYIFNINPQNGYFKYQLVNIAALRGKTGRSNKYPKMLYIFLKSYAEQGSITVSLEDFRTIHCPTEYTEYRRINQRILSDAQEKINELTDITFTYKAIKAKGSRSTTHIQFFITKKKGKALEELEDKQYTAIDGAPWVDLPF